MTRGRAVQVGSPADLFERPSHTFVGNFIGSPGMNFLTGNVDRDGIHFSGATLPMPAGRAIPAGKTKLGIRPEYVTVVPAHSSGALEMTVCQVQDVGTYVLLAAQFAGCTVKARLPSGTEKFSCGDAVWLKLMGEHTCFYRDEEILP